MALFKVGDFLVQKGKKCETVRKPPFKVIFSDGNERELAKVAVKNCVFIYDEFEPKFFYAVSAVVRAEQLDNISIHVY